MAGEEVFIMAGSIGLLMLIIGFVAGKIMDPFFKAKMLRSFTKKEYGCLGLVSKDKRSVRIFVVNFNKFLLNVGDKVWAGASGRIYREDAVEKGFVLNQKSVKFREGVPIVYVDEESLTPLDWWTDAGKVSPEEVGAVMTAWISNQLAKKQARGSQNLQLFLIIAILASVAGAFLAYQAMDKVEKMAGTVNLINAKVDQVGTLVMYGNQTTNKGTYNANGGTWVVPG